MWNVVFIGPTTFLAFLSFFDRQGRKARFISSMSRGPFTFRSILPKLWARYRLTSSLASLMSLLRSHSLKICLACSRRAFCWAFLYFGLGDFSFVVIVDHAEHLVARLKVVGSQGVDGRPIDYHLHVAI